MAVHILPALAHSMGCPSTLNGGALPPSFVRDHCYCESGSTRTGLHFGAYFTGDPLWDRRGCSASNSCCAQPNLPWFYCQIPLTNNDNIEARICYDQAFWRWSHTSERNSTLCTIAAEAGLITFIYAMYLVPLMCNKSHKYCMCLWAFVW